MENRLAFVFGGGPLPSPPTLHSFDALVSMPWLFPAFLTLFLALYIMVCLPPQLFPRLVVLCLYPPSFTFFWFSSPLISHVDSRGSCTSAPPPLL